MSTQPVSEKQILRSAQNDSGDVPATAPQFGAGSAKAHAVPAPLILDPVELIEFQRGQIRRKEYTPLGRLERIDLSEDCLPNTAPDNPLLGRWTADQHPMAPALDWLNKGPMLALSKDEQDILVCTHAIHPPPLVDPEWKRKIPTPLQFKDGVPLLDQPATIEQSLLHRCWVGPNARWVKTTEGKWVPDGEWFVAGKNGEQWMLFQPVSQILLFLMNGGWGIINCRADMSGRHTVFMYDREREEGHILFGHKEFNRHFEVLKSV